MSKTRTMIKVLPPMVEKWINMEDFCFVTGKQIRRWEQARFTWEFDAWVSIEGQKIIEENARGENPNEESRIIFAEWYAQDEADAANDEWRQGYR
tara:strand:+ start:167 stop:451 length:285 start_codon:yes stop_codon:yes gene_type:complete